MDIDSDDRYRFAGGSIQKAVLPVDLLIQQMEALRTTGIATYPARCPALFNFQWKSRIRQPRRIGSVNIARFRSVRWIFKVSSPCRATASDPGQKKETGAIRTLEMVLNFCTTLVKSFIIKCTLVQAIPNNYPASSSGLYVDFQTTPISRLVE